MSYTYRSSTCVGKTNSSVKYVDIAKPTGLAVGDLMVSIIGWVGTNYITTRPTGWTKFDITDEDNFDLAYKIADSNDVAATNFRFEEYYATVMMGASISVFYTPEASQIIWSAKEGLEGTLHDQTPEYAISVSNVIGESLVIVGILEMDNAVPAISSFQIATDNPEWNTIGSAAFDEGGIGRTLFLYYANRTTTNSSTGNLSAVFANVPTTSVAIITTLPVYKENTVAETITLSETVVNSVSSTLSDTVTITDSIIDEENPYVNVSKNVASWTDGDKNSSSWTDASKNSSSWTNTSK